MKISTNVIKVNSELRLLIQDFLINNGAFNQILYKDSEKPIVLHEKTNQITYVKDGSGILVLDSKKLNIEKGDILVIQKGQNHAFLCNESELNLYHLHCPKENLDLDRFIVGNVV